MDIKVKRNNLFYQYFLLFLIDWAYVVTRTLNGNSHNLNSKVNCYHLIFTLLYIK